MDIQDNLVESDLRLLTTQFESGERDFCLHKMDASGQIVAVNPLELLVLDRALDIIDKEAKTNPPKAMNLALCRLLVPSVKTKRVGRHLAIEQWSQEAVSGQTLGQDVRSAFAAELSREQAECWRVVQAGGVVSEGLEEIFWDALTELPGLEREFHDPDLGKFGKALYHHLVRRAKATTSSSSGPSWRRKSNGVVPATFAICNSDSSENTRGNCFANTLR